MVDQKSFYDILEVFSAGFDAKKVALKLAARDPKLFLEIVNEKTWKSQWHVEVVNMLEASEIVSAIKHVRAKTGMGLKEAKDVIDWLRYDMYEFLSMTGARPMSLSPLNSNIQCETLNALKVEVRGRNGVL